MKKQRRNIESCSSRSVNLVSRNQRLMLDVFSKVLCRLKELNDKDASLLGFEEELWTHFCAGGALGHPPPDSPTLDSSEKVYIFSLALLKINSSAISFTILLSDLLDFH
ncbi:hypothetical protein DKX38_003744 [Salix brachista]|uniref:Uncharacterized protein n=1 Tax=Salix brachista TaxID=2182728 RepID=A0A5N5N8I5_9ROSI|nr:hypothetical protein DKX38_003744 [Salix brachista]